MSELGATMTEAFWNGQMQFSVIIGDFADLLLRAERESVAWAIGKSFERIAYGDQDRQWVETIEGNGPAEILPVVVHGGYWRALQAENHRFLMQSLLPFGSVVANVEYRLVPEVALGDVVGDTKAALRALVDRFPEKRLVLVGHSAGAHLSVAALDDPDLAARIAGVIALSGVYDLRPVRHSFLKDELFLSEDDVAKHSLHPRPDRPPVVYVNGSDETYEFLRGSALMAGEGRSSRKILPDANHMTLLWAASAQMENLFETLYAI